MAAEITKYSLALVALLCVTAYGFGSAWRGDESGEPLALFGGVASALTLFYLVRNCLTKRGRARLAEKAARKRGARRFGGKAGLAGAAGALLAWVLLKAGAFARAVAEEGFVLYTEEWFTAPLAVWLGVFVIGLLCYPVQRRCRDGIESLPHWASLNAAMAFLGVIVYHVHNWLI